MATIILSIVIISFVGYVVYRWIKRGFGAECADCESTCPVKHEMKRPEEH